MNIKYLILALVLGSACVLSAQRMEMGLWGGISSYSGDFTPKEASVYFKSLQPGGGLFLRMNPHDAVSFEVGLSTGRLSGEDGVTNDFGERGLNFRTSITELAVKTDVHLFRLGQKKRTQAVPYFMLGAAVFKFNPETNFDGNWIEVQPLGTEGQGAPGYDDLYSLTQAAILTGGGLKFIMKERVTIGLELGARLTFTDFLDDVSGNTVNYLDVLENNGSLAAEISKPNVINPEADFSYTRGGEYDDWYFFGGVSFSFAFGEGSGVHGKGIGCPTF